MFLGEKKTIKFVPMMVQTVFEYGKGRLEFVPLFAKLAMAEKQQAERPCVPKWF